MAIIAHLRVETFDLESEEVADHVGLDLVLYGVAQVAAHLRGFREEECYLMRALRSLEEAEGSNDRCQASMIRYRVLFELV